MSYLYRNSKQFAHFPSALYLTDVNFYYANRSQEKLQESKLFCNSKPHLYGYKTDVLVSPSNFAVRSNKHQPGSCPDNSSFRAKKEQHDRFLKKLDDAESVLDLACEQPL